MMPYRLKITIRFFYLTFKWIEKLLELVAMAMLVAMVVIICYQVTLRFCFNYSPSWTEEIAIVLMIWFGMLSIPIGVKLNLHIGIEYLFNRFPNILKPAAARLIYLLIVIFGGLMVSCGIELVEFMSMSTLPATKISSAVEYIVVPISGAMLIFVALEKIFTNVDFKQNEAADCDMETEIKPELSQKRVSDNAT